MFQPNGKLLWKNPPAKSNASYQPTTTEHLFNIFTHGACVLPAVYATWALVHKSTTPCQLWAGLIYGTALIMLFTVSTAFHTSCYLCNSKSRLRKGLHRGDRAMIYIFIASSYFPWLTIMQNMDSVIDLRYTIWILAAAGILYQQVFHEKYKWLETIIYLMIAVLPSTPFVCTTEFEGMWELKIGGAFYMVGLIFFKCDGVVPLAHAIWHLHVSVGASIHYYAVFIYLMGPKQYKLETQ